MEKMRNKSDRLPITILKHKELPGEPMGIASIGMCPAVFLASSCFVAGAESIRLAENHVAADGAENGSAEAPSSSGTTDGGSSAGAPISGALHLYHCTTLARARKIIKHGFVATLLADDDKTSTLFYPKSYTRKPIGHDPRLRPEGGSGIYFGIGDDQMWRGGSLMSGLWGLAHNAEVRLIIPEASGLSVFDMRDQDKRAYVSRWCGAQGREFVGRAVDAFSREHSIDLLIRRGRTGRESYIEAILKTERAFDFVNGLPKELHRNS